MYQSFKYIIQSNSKELFFHYGHGAWKEINQVYKLILRIERLLDDGLPTNELIVNCLLSTSQLIHFPLTLYFV